MSDILVKLLLATDNYEKNLKGAKESSEQFEKAISFAKESFLKLAAAFGAATTAGEAFKDIIESNQTTADKFENIINAAKGSVEEFFRSMATGDFGAFNSGLLVAYQNAFDLSAMLDELGDKKLSLSYIHALDTRDIAKYTEIARDTTKSLAERKAAAAALQKTVDDLDTKTRATIDLSVKTMNKEYANASGLNFTKADFEKFYGDTNFSGASSEAAKAVYKKYLDYGIKARSAGSVQVYGGYGGFSGGNLSASQKFLDMQKAYLKANEDIIKQGFLEETNDKKRLGTLNEILANLAREQEIYELTKRANKTRDTITRVEAKKVPEIFAPDTSGDIEKRIKDLQKKIEHATSDGARFGFQKAIDDLQLILDRRTFAAKMTAMPDKNFFMDYQKLPQLRPASLDSALNDNIKPIIEKKDVNNLDSYNSALGTMQNMLVSISNATNSGAAGWLTYGANALQALSNTYLALAKVIPALQVKAVSEGASQQAAAGPLGWVAAIASIGAMLAAFATLPKYATGGFVTGGLTTGDQTLIRANAGELILNVAQQRNIAAQLNNKGQNVKVEVEGRVSGRDLEFVMTKRQRYLER